MTPEASPAHRRRRRRRRRTFGLRPRLVVALVLTAAVTLGVAALALLSPLGKAVDSGESEQALGVDADLSGFLHRERPVRQRAQQRALARQRVTDRLRSAGDGPTEILHADRAQPVVERSERRHLGHRDQVAPAEAPDHALDAALLVGALQPDRLALRFEQVVRAQRTNRRRAPAGDP